MMLWSPNGSGLSLWHTGHLRVSQLQVVIGRRRRREIPMCISGFRRLSSGQVGMAANPKGSPLLDSSWALCLVLRELKRSSHHCSQGNLDGKLMIGVSSKIF